MSAVANPQNGLVGREAGFGPAVKVRSTEQIVADVFSPRTGTFLAFTETPLDGAARKRRAVLRGACPGERTRPKLPARAVTLMDGPARRVHFAPLELLSIQSIAARSAESKQSRLIVRRGRTSGNERDVPIHSYRPKNAAAPYLVRARKIESSSRSECVPEILATSSPPSVLRRTAKFYVRQLSFSYHRHAFRHETSRKLFI